MALIRRLTLSNFRNYRSVSVEAGDARTIVLCGPNGAGKTNLIEAISFLTPGRGLRRATLDEVAFQEGDGSWAVSADVDGALRLATLGTGIEAPAADAVTTGHAHRINALERALRSRNRLLEEPRPDPHWLDAIEHETAELAVAVASLRAETVHRLEAVVASAEGSR